MNHFHKISDYPSAAQKFDKLYCELFETDNFVAIPSIGSLVEGWLLIVPKQYYISMGSLGSLDKKAFVELKAFISQVKAVLGTLYGHVTIFEHGPASYAQPVGCSVDYAHLHLVPTQFSLIEKAREMFPQVEWCQVTDLEACTDLYLKGKEYLYVYDPFRGSFIASFPNIPSQFFRKVIAENIGAGDRYNWRQYPEEHNTKATIKRVTSFKKLQDLQSILANASLAYASKKSHVRMSSSVS